MISYLSAVDMTDSGWYERWVASVWSYGWACVQGTTGGREWQPVERVDTRCFERAAKYRIGRHLWLVTHLKPWIIAPAQRRGGDALTLRKSFANINHKKLGAGAEPTPRGTKLSSWQPVFTLSYSWLGGFSPWLTLTLSVKLEYHRFKEENKNGFLSRWPHQSHLTDLVTVIIQEPEHVSYKTKNKKCTCPMFLCKTDTINTSCAFWC